MDQNQTNLYDVLTRGAPADAHVIAQLEHALTRRGAAARIREAAGADYMPWPIEIVSGDAAPSIAGERWHYRTWAGEKVRNPAAYRKVGWSNCRYVASTRRVHVGAEWLRALARLGGAA